MCLNSVLEAWLQKKERYRSWLKKEFKKGFQPFFLRLERSSMFAGDSRANGEKELGMRAMDPKQDRWSHSL